MASANSVFAKNGVEVFFENLFLIFAKCFSSFFFS